MRATQEPTNPQPRYSDRLQPTVQALCLLFLLPSLVPTDCYRTVLPVHTGAVYHCPQAESHNARLLCALALGRRDRFPTRKLLMSAVFTTNRRRVVYSDISPSVRLFAVWHYCRPLGTSKIMGTVAYKPFVGRF